MENIKTDGKYHDIIPGVILEKYGRYIQGNYNDIEAWKNNWPEETRRWRGHIYDQVAKEFVARPMDKFFKYKDLPEINESYFNMLISKSKDFNILPKIDGTLIIGWFDKYGSDSWRVSTRGMIDFKNELLDNKSIPINFHHEAEAYLRNSLFYRNVFDPENKWMNNYTFCFELVHPDNRIVSRYHAKDFGMHLICMRNVFTGKEIIQRRVIRIGEKMNLKTIKPKKSMTGQKALDNLLEYKKSHSDKDVNEGFVARFDLIDGTTHRIKFITDQYLSLKWIYKSAGDKFYLRHLNNGTFDEMCKTLPQELKDKALLLYYKYKEVENTLKGCSELAKQKYEPGSRGFHEYLVERYNPIFIGLIHSISKGCSDISKYIKLEHLKCDYLVTKDDSLQQQ